MRALSRSSLIAVRMRTVKAYAKARDELSAWRPGICNCSRWMARLLVIAAHPDAESAGAASLLTTLPDCAVVHLSDGVPRDRSQWASGAASTPDGYSSQRR